MGRCGIWRNPSTENFIASGKLLKFQQNFMRLVLALCCSVGLSSALAADAQSPVLAHLANGEVITEADVSQYLDARVDLRSASKNVAGVENIVREMALARALTLEGAKLGVERPAEGSDRRFDDIYAHRVFSQMRPKCEEPQGADAARAFYNSNLAAFTAPAMLRLSRIILPASASVKGEPALAWLNAQVQGIGAKTTTFDAAAQVAETVYKLDVQGDLGWVAMTGEISLLRILAQTKVGDLVGPLREGDYVYLFHVVGKRDGGLLPWEQVAASAAKRAVSYCREQGDKHLREEMQRKYGIEIDAAAIKAMFERFDSAAQTGADDAGTGAGAAGGK